MEALRHTLDDLAAATGLAALGVTTAEPFSVARQAIEDRVNAGHHARLRFTFSDPATSTDVRSSFPWAERIVVASRAYLPHAGSPIVELGEGQVARFAVEDPYEPMREALERIGAVLERAGYRAEVLIDDNRLVDRAAAIRAGIGWAGKSTLVLDPRHGPWIVLGSVVTDAPLEVGDPMVRTCGTCDACIPACPTGAIVEPGVLDARLCLAAWAQTGGVVPVDLRQAMADRIYGCDDCLDACPPGGRLLALATEKRGGVDLVELLGTADDDLRRRFAHFYLPKNDPDVLRRNALIVLGNQADPANVGVIAAFLGHYNPVLRAHAAWALGRMDDDRSRPALRFAHQGETHEMVIAEIEAALSQ